MRGAIISCMRGWSLSNYVLNVHVICVELISAELDLVILQKICTICEIKNRAKVTSFTVYTQKTDVARSEKTELVGKNSKTKILAQLDSAHNAEWNCNATFVRTK